MFSNMNKQKCWWKKNHISNSKCTMDELNFFKKKREWIVFFQLYKQPVQLKNLH